LQLSEVSLKDALGRLVKLISSMPMTGYRTFPNKPRIVIFTSSDDIEAKQRVIELINSGSGSSRRCCRWSKYAKHT